LFTLKQGKRILRLEPERELWHSDGIRRQANNTVEDQSRIRKDHAPENMAILKYMALSLLKQEKTNKRGIRAKRLKAGWSDCYLLKVLTT